MSLDHFPVAMTFTKIAPVVFAGLLCSVFLATTATAQRSALFSVVQLSGKAQCSTDIPSATLRARSAIECSLSCEGLQDECCAFNFIKDKLTCELYDNVMYNNCTVGSACALYKVNKTRQGKKTVSKKNSIILQTPRKVKGSLLWIF